MRNNNQKVFFDGEMRPVMEVASVLAENGRSVDFIYRRISFLLGLTSFEQDNTTIPSRYPCTFECVIERMEVRRG
jgi:hypothetical protein